MEILTVLARSLEALRLIFMPGCCCAAFVSNWRPGAKRKSKRRIVRIRSRRPPRTVSLPHQLISRADIRSVRLIVASPGLPCRSRALAAIDAPMTAAALMNYVEW